MAEKSTFARRVRAAKPPATKYEVRDDVVTGLAADDPAHWSPVLLPLPHGTRAQAVLDARP